MWDAEAGRELAVLKGHTADVKSVSFSPDGTRVVTAAGDGTAHVWDADTGKLLLTFQIYTQSKKSGQFPVLFAEFSDDGSCIRTASFEEGRSVGTTVRVGVYDTRPVNRAFVKPAPLDFPLPVPARNARELPPATARAAAMNEMSFFAAALTKALGAERQAFLDAACVSDIAPA